MKFTFRPLNIPEVLLIQGEQFQDKRGSFSESYRANVFEEYNIGPFIQENYSVSKKDVIRGLHYQAEPMQVGKLVSCPHGCIFDVAVDIREGSKTYGQWVSAFLENGNAMLWIPEGFAHGFCVLSDTANVLYRQTQYYSKEHDRAIRWDDPNINITWPINDPFLSEKDEDAPLLRKV